MFNKYLYLLLFTCIAFPVTAGIIKSEKINSKTINNSSIQKVRIDFTTPAGYVRHLLLGFTPNNAATDGFDYGYDALNVDNFPDDLNWMIDNQRCVTQGVGAFNETKVYPLGLFLTNSGDIKIELKSLENFTQSINVYVFDSLLNTYTLINNQDYTGFSNSGTYTERYFITFTDNSELVFLDIEENERNELSVFYNKATKELHISNNHTIEEIAIYDCLARRIVDLKDKNKRDYFIPLNALNTFYIVHIKSNDRIESKKIIIPI